MDVQEVVIEDVPYTTLGVIYITIILLINVKLYTVIETALMMSCIVVVYVGGWVNKESMLLWWLLLEGLASISSHRIIFILYRFRISMDYYIHICINR